MNKAKYYIYRNLHKNMFSIQYKQKVIDRNNFQIIKEVKFVISKKGQDRVRKEKRKNVHAKISGFLVSKDDFDLSKFDLIELYYNPYIHNNFIIRNSNINIFATEFVLAKDNRIYKLELKKEFKNET